MPNAHNLRRRRAWPQVAGQQRAQAEQTARDHGENLRDTLNKLASLRSARPELAVELTEIERDVAVAALAFDDIKTWMEEAGVAAAQAVAPGPDEQPPGAGG